VGHNGILLADRSVSSTQDYYLIVDSGGNAVCVFNNTSTQIVAQKSAGGHVPVGGDGDGDRRAASQGPPKVAELTDGNFVVAWSESNALRAQKLTSGGAPAGALFAPAAETGHATFMSDICAAESGGFIVLFTRSSGIELCDDNRQIFTQKYGSSYAQWTPTPDVPARWVHATR